MKCHGVRIRVTQQRRRKARAWAREVSPGRYVRLDSTSFFQETSAIRTTSRT